MYTAPSLPLWSDAATFMLVEAQTDYVFPVGSAADTNATHALVQWGAIVLVPNTDYSILSDRIVLTNAPSAAQAAGGEPLVVRFRRP